MALKKINYNGSSKVILRLCEMVNQLIDGGGGGGSTVTYTQTLSSGTKTGSISIDGVSTDMYAPTQPTKVSDLQNDSGFIDNTVNNLTNYYLKSQTYTQAEVDALISAIVTLNILVVQTLPTQDISTTTIYLVPKQTPETQDIYDEYIYVNNAWEHIGTTQIDLSNYYTKTQTDNLLADKVDKVTGKQLSTEDFTSALKTKLEGIASGAEVNVQSDWSQSDNTADDYIKNKPTNVSDFNNDSGFITGVDVEDIGDVDLNNLANGQVLKYNSSTQKWENQNESGGGSSYTEGDGIDISAQNVISVDTTFSEASTRTNIASGDTFATILGKIKKFFSDLKTVAFSGSADDVAYDSNTTIKSAVDGKVSKSGDTMTGDLTLGKASTVLKIRASGSRYSNITSSATESDKDIVLPNKSGTVALTSDIPTSLPANGGNADTVDNIHYFMDRYTSTVTLDQPTASTEWGILITSNNWDNYAQVIQVTCNGSNRASHMVLYTLARTGDFWGYQTVYNSAGVTGISIAIGSATNVHLRISSNMTEVTIRKSFTGTATEVEALQSSYTKIGYGFFTKSVNCPCTFCDYVSIEYGTQSNLFIGGSSSKAHLHLYNGNGSSDNYTLLETNNNTGIPKVVSFPAKGGTVAMTSDISSIKSKENVKPLTDEEVIKLLDVEVVTFDYKKGIVGENERYNNRGVIAEQVEPLIPYVVEHEKTEESEEETLRVDYRKFIPYLIKMVQLQQKQIDNLMAEISALKGDK